jgi:transcriptional regulator with XRE-family HTH domain
LSCILDMGLKLRELRHARGWCVRELAARAGVDFTAINRAELGKTMPRLETLERLAKALGVGVKDLIETGK